MGIGSFGQPIELDLRGRTAPVLRQYAREADDRAQREVAAPFGACAPEAMKAARPAWLEQHKGPLPPRSPRPCVENSVAMAPSHVSDPGVMDVQMRLAAPVCFRACQG